MTIIYSPEKNLPNYILHFAISVLVYLPFNHQFVERELKKSMQLEAVNMATGFRKLTV